MFYPLYTVQRLELYNLVVVAAGKTLRKKRIYNLLDFKQEFIQ